MTAVLELPEIVEAPTDDEPIHIMCCNNNRALCGLDVSGEPWMPDAPEEDDCPLCVDIYDSGLSCGAVGCSVRRWLRDRFGRSR